MSAYQHQSVLAKEAIDFLQPKKGQNFIDCTLGGGGHTSAILEKTSPSGKVLAFELDPRACRAAAQNLRKYKDRVKIVRSSYVNLGKFWAEYRDELLGISGVLLDLGLSSDQLDQADRGFSFKDEGPLDMRFDPDGQTVTASDIILRWPEEKLVNIFREYGEIKIAKRLAKYIVQWRVGKQKQKAIKTSSFVSAILPILLSNQKNKQKTYRIHPATQVFQALRLAVNDELENLRRTLPQAVKVLSSGGRLAVISFHSLEDRIVKQYFQSLAKGCICPPELPVCRCGRNPEVKIITKKPVRPAASEVSKNPRSRSALLRVIEKI